MRWDPGFLCSGDEFEAFWAALATEGERQRSGLLIAGRGFDPRTTAGPGAIARAGFPIDSCVLIRLTNPQDSPDRPRSREAAANEITFRNLFGNDSVMVEEIAGRDEEGRTVGSAHIRSLFANENALDCFTDVIVDITAVPTSISFPLLGALISYSDNIRGDESCGFNLHCIVCENSDLDDRTVAEGGDVAEYIDPFRGRGGLAADPDPITIWAPVLGERQPVVLRKIYDMLRPQEVKPFLPSPSRNPRRGDDLVAEYHSLLFDTWEVDPRGFIYADERDPFDIYRQLGELAEDYARSLEPLGTARTVVSAHSSKLLSLGILLAAFEHTLAITHVEPTSYSLDTEEVSLDSNELFEVWLTGEPYADT